MPLPTSAYRCLSLLNPFAFALGPLREISPANSCDRQLHSLAPGRVHSFGPLASKESWLAPCTPGLRDSHSVTFHQICTQSVNRIFCHPWSFLPLCLSNGGARAGSSNAARPSSAPVDAVRHLNASHVVLPAVHLDSRPDLTPLRFRGGGSPGSPRLAPPHTSVYDFVAHSY